MDKKIKLPMNEQEIENLKIGDFVSVSGVIYVARDAAHKRLQDMLDTGEKLPFDIKNNIIYYMGPSPAREGRVIGAAGPTTSGRMDKYTPALLDLGLKGMIGKGKRSEQVKQAVIRNKAVYFTAVGGAGAILSKAIIKSEIVAFEDLGAEAILKLEVENFPVIVSMDCKGNDLYETAVKGFKRED